MIKFTFCLKGTPDKRKTQFSLNYFSGSVGAQEWVTGEAQLGLLELHPEKGENPAKQRHVSHNPTRDPHITTMFTFAFW